MEQNVENNIVKLCCGKIVRKPREDWVLPKLCGLGKKQWSVSRAMGVGTKLEVVPNQPFYKTQINKKIGIGAWQWTWGRHFVKNRFLFFFLGLPVFPGEFHQASNTTPFYKLKTWHSVSSTPVLFTKCLVQSHLVNVQGDSLWLTPVVLQKYLPSCSQILHAQRIWSSTGLQAIQSLPRLLAAFLALHWQASACLGLQPCWWCTFFLPCCWRARFWAVRSVSYSDSICHVPKTRRGLASSKLFFGGFDQFSMAVMLTVACRHHFDTWASWWRASARNELEGERLELLWELGGDYNRPKDSWVRKN